MSFWSGLGLSGGSVVATAGAAAVVVAGAMGFQMTRPSTDPQQTPVVAIPDGDAGSEATATTAPETDETVIAPETPVEEAEPALRLPVFELVRVDAEGSAVVAGVAEPNSRVQIFVDQVLIAEAQSGPDGKFVALFDVAPSDAAQSLSLALVAGDELKHSDERILIAPFGAPVAVAEAPETPEETALAALDDTVLETTDVDAAEAPADNDPSQAEDSDDGADPELVTTPHEKPEVEDAVVATTAPDESVPDAPAEAETVAVLDADEPEVPAATDPDTNEVAETVREDVVAALEEEAAPAAPALIKTTKEGVELLSPGPEIQTSVIVDTISYDAEGDVNLTGRGQSDRAIRFYLDNRPVGTARISVDGTWRTPLPDIDAGVYTLRVDEIDAEGVVTSRFETPFQRETPEIVEAALNADENSLRAQAGIITVQPGYTLWAIAKENYGDGVLYVKVYEANKDLIRDPDLIYPGQIFEVPDE